jgi:DNA-binding HxlR family transcriptional regulator
MRSYRDPCGIARALDVVGERWALLIVRELLLGPKRYTDLQAALVGLSPDVLADRLRELQAAGVVRRATLPPPAPSKLYELTDRGRELEPVLLALGRWGSREAFPPGDRPLGVDAFVLALPTLFDAVAAKDIAITVQLGLGADRFVVQVDGGRLDVARGEAEHHDVSIDGDVEALVEVLWHGRRLAEAEAEDAIRIVGPRRAARRFLQLFPPPRAVLRDDSVSRPASSSDGTPTSSGGGGSVV